MRIKFYFILKNLAVPAFFLCLTSIYLFPLLQGLILLPLDLLIGKYTPWYSPGTILLKNPYMQDSIIQLFPWRHLTFDSLIQGIIPLWNPYQFLGMPFMANLKSMVFYPLNLLFFTGEITSWNILLFLQIFLGMLFSYYLAKDFKLKALPSIFTSLAFGLNSYMMGLLEFGSDAHTIIWWPLIILFIKRYLEKKQTKNLFFLSFTLACSILAGQLQYLGYFLFIIIAFSIFYGRILKVQKSEYIKLLMSLVLGFGICAIQLIPSIELFSNSHRGLLSPAQNHEIYSRGLVFPYEHFRLFSPDLFGNPVTGDEISGYIETSGYFGIIPLFFTIFAIIFARKNKFVIFFTYVFIVSLLLSLKGIGDLLYMLKIPLITSGSGNRIFTILLFSGTLLSGFGLTEFIESKNKKKQYISVLSFLIFYILAIGLFISFIKGSRESINIILQHIQFSSIILCIFILGSIFYFFSLTLKKHAKYVKLLFLIFILGITFFDLFRLGYRFLTFSNIKFLYPQTKVVEFLKDTQFKNLGRSYGLIEPELGSYLKLNTIETYNPLYLLRTSKLLQSLQNIPINKLSSDNKYLLSNSGGNLKNTLDIMGVTYIIASIDDNPATKYFNSNKYEQELKKIYSDDKYAVFLNQKVYPRFGLYYQDTIIKNETDILNSLSKNKIDLRSNVILEEKLPFTLQKGTGSVKLISSTLNSQIFEASSSKPAIFYISDTYFPGWTAKVNNRNTKIYRANYNFRAVPIPAGRAVVEFTYLPQSFIIGIWVSILSLFILIIVSAFPSKR